jgi:hypothetical protein
MNIVGAQIRVGNIRSKYHGVHSFTRCGVQLFFSTSFPAELWEKNIWDPAMCPGLLEASPRQKN